MPLLNSLSIGSMVHYIMPNGEHRPAIVVNVISEGTCNLQVFTDPVNDLKPDAPENQTFNELVSRGIMFQADVPFGTAEQVGSWHCPEVL